jgi:membrane protein implicated in regulation of membrane protease activity
MNIPRSELLTLVAPKADMPLTTTELVAGVDMAFSWLLVTPVAPLLSTTLLWLVAGAILCLMEMFLPTAFVEFMMGISALLVAGISLVLPQFPLQVVLWLVFSTVLIYLSRRFMPRRRIMIIEDAREGETLTAIAAGETGRVLYEGNSWRARCEDYEQAIAPHQKVYVVRREGNTLIVMPEHLLRQ